MDVSQIVLAVAAGSLALNGYFMRGVARDLRELQGRTGDLEKNEAVQEWRLHQLDGGGTA